MKTQQYLTYGLAAIATALLSFTHPNTPVVPEGEWRGVFHNANGTDVPFNFEIKGKNIETAKFYLINGEEHFEAGQPVLRGDSLFVPFDQFDNELALKVDGEKLT